MSDANGSGVVDRLFRGYGPLIGFLATFLAIALIVPTQRQEVVTQPTSASAAGTVDESGAVVDGETAENPDGTSVAPDGSTPADATGGTGGDVAAGGGGGGTGAGGGTGGSGGGGSGGGGGGGGGGSGVTPCGTAQVKGDPYSPPCYKWNGGDNGGSTSKGVTKDAITVAVRMQAFKSGVTDALSKVAGAKIASESSEKIERTIRSIADYFNKYYTFYGRKLNVVTYEGKGQLEREILGGGTEGASTDALKVATEINAFADVSAVSPPYVDALFKQKVVTVGAPYLSKQWMQARRPYAWSTLTDCSTVVSAVGSYYNAKLGGKPAAYARGDLQNKPRRTAIIAPDNSWYQECVKAGIDIINKGGFGGEIKRNEPYRIDLNDLLPQAANLVSKLKSDNITTVVCGCDPILLVYLTSKAREQNYRPEFVETGVAFTDLDLVGQIMEQDVWGGAFGVSFNGKTTPLIGGPGYAAAKAVGNADPSQAADLIYYQFQLLAIGVQMAGPRLTPESFEQGMFRYPQRTGPAGAWKFGPNDYTTSEDAREIYYSPSTRSPQNNDPGAWLDPSNGTKRYAIGAFPKGEPVTGR